MLLQAGVVGRLASGHATALYSAARSAVEHAVQASRPAIPALIDGSEHPEDMQRYRHQDDEQSTSNRAAGGPKSTAETPALTQSRPGAYGRKRYVQRRLGGDATPRRKII